MARLDKRIFIQAGLLTIMIFVSIYALNMAIEGEREKAVTNRMNDIISEFEEIETTAYLMEYMGEEHRNNTCEVMKKEIDYLEGKLWKLDIKIRDYREITKDFMNDAFYIQEKKKLNQREIIHMTMQKKMMNACQAKYITILYFYGECDKNKQCDEQGFVLSYINQQVDEEISVFSFDKDLEIPAVSALMELYNVTKMPCVVVEGDTYCGLHNKDEMIDIICLHGNVSFCENRNTYAAGNSTYESKSAG